MEKIKRLFQFSCAIAFLAWFEPASAMFQAAADSTLRFDLDFARFAVNDTTAQVEVYIAVPRLLLQHTKSEGQLVASFQCQVSIVKNGEESLSHRWQAQSMARDAADIKPGQLLFTQARFQLTVGLYRFYVRVHDTNNPARHGERAFQIMVEPYPAGQLALSDLQLASHLERDTTHSIFHKNRHLVLPNPGALYGLELPVLYFYAEIYNLHFPSDSAYSVQYRLEDGEGNVVKALPSKRRPIAGAKLVEVGGFNIVTLKTGSYFFEMRVVDHTTGAQASRRRKFFIYREKDQPAMAQEISTAALEFLAQIYRRRSEKELDKEFEMARYISSPEEKKIYGSLKPDGKRDFLAKFWQKRDQSPETPRNEYRENYLALARFANDNFSGFREGWKTDMGRVLLVYGQPDEIERFPSSNDARAHQIWRFFEIEGGIEFIFVELRSGGEMELVHSTARNELQDPTWQRWLNPGR
ncbi:MAG: GWxTD domain-containing protein [candidate division KSB1 bacterium]|nr:GWxTD domain-containing protein [candidate division KSB1 bacterium]